MLGEKLKFDFILSDEVKANNMFEDQLNAIFTAFKLPEDELVKVSWSNGTAYYDKKAVEEFIQKGNWLILH